MPNWERRANLSTNGAKSIGVLMGGQGGLRLLQESKRHVQASEPMKSAKQIGVLMGGQGGLRLLQGSKRHVQESEPWD